MTNIGAFDKFKQQLKILKVILIVLIGIKIINLLISYVFLGFYISIEHHKIINMFVWGFHYAVVVVFLWFNWKKMPLTKKVKIKYTFAFLLIGVIGMWLWLPNKNELKHMVLDDFKKR
ncbi:MAG: hypothetical protein Q8K70_07455 [Bacteroidota bacterium]|nr:hypothetical protein [Bacteroidota bacterium]